MRRSALSLMVGAPCALLALTPGPVRAQIIARDFPASLPGYETDMTLPMPYEDPRAATAAGLRFGDVLVTPTVGESLGFNSNPLGSGGGGSGVAESTASVSLDSDWARDAVSARLSVDDQRYLELPIASQTNWTAAAGGAVDVLGSRIDLGYSHLAENLGPQQLGTLGVTAPVPYAVDDLRLDDDLVFGRVRLVPAIEYSMLSFGTASGSFGNYGSLDRTTETGTLTGLFELSKARSLVVLLRDTTAQYRRQAGGNPNANYNDALVFVGVDLQADPVIRLRALLGGETRQFGSPLHSSATTPAAEIDVIWQPTRLTQVTLSVSRRFEDAASLQSNSATVTDGRIEIDHALLRDVALSAFADIGTSDFQSGLQGISYGQTQENFGFSATWTVMRHVELVGTYEYETSLASAGTIPATSTFGSIAGLSSTTNIVTLGLRLSF